LALVARQAQAVATQCLLPLLRLVVVAEAYPTGALGNPAVPAVVGLAAQPEAREALERQIRVMPEARVRMDSATLTRAVAVVVRLKLGALGLPQVKRATAVTVLLRQSQVPQSLALVVEALALTQRGQALAVLAVAGEAGTRNLLSTRPQERRTPAAVAVAVCQLIESLVVVQVLLCSLYRLTQV